MKGDGAKTAKALGLHEGGSIVDKSPVSIASNLDRSGVLAGRLKASFAWVVVVATVICALLLIGLVRVGGYVHQMQADESAIRASLELAMAIREQHIHAAHTIVAGDESHVDHYSEWVRKVQYGTRTLRGIVPKDELGRLDRIEQQSVEADRVFRFEVLAAIHAHDREWARRGQDQIDALASRAANDADEVARQAELRMSHAHTDATHVTYTAGAIALVGIVSLIVLSVFFTRRLHEAVLQPLRVLVDAAQRIGAGDYGHPTGPAVGEFGVVTNAFERMADELAARERLLVQHERMAAIGQLAAGVAHEINNPIAVIRGYLRTMIPEASQAELRDELKILDEEAAACQRIAEDLVTFARTPDISKSSADMQELVKQVGERFEASGESQGCAITVQAEPSIVNVDALRMRQVIQNLLRNAVAASPGHTGVEVRGERNGDLYRIGVLDRGEGIAEDLKPRIFEPFLSGRSSGTGLGLAICEGIVRAHGGHIDVKDRTGGGSEFWIQLPMTSEGGKEIAHGN